MRISHLTIILVLAAGLLCAQPSSRVEIGDYFLINMTAEMDTSMEIPMMEYYDGMAEVSFDGDSMHYKLLYKQASDSGTLAYSRYSNDSIAVYIEDEETMQGFTTANGEFMLAGVAAGLQGSIVPLMRKNESRTYANSAGMYNLTMLQYSYEAMIDKREDLAYHSYSYSGELDLRADASGTISIVDLDTSDFRFRLPGQGEIIVSALPESGEEQGKQDDYIDIIAGAITPGGDLMALTWLYGDTSDAYGNGMLMLAGRQQSGMDNSVIVGDYYFMQLAGESNGGFAFGQKLAMRFDGSGNGSYEVIAYSIDEAEVGESGTLTYLVNDDGSLSVNVPTPDDEEATTLRGFVNHSGDVFSTVWQETEDEVFGFGIGIRKGSTQTSLTTPQELQISSFSLENNYPNPFNPSTEITFKLRQAMPVEIAIYNALGIKINVLTNSLYPQGQHRITWNGSDQHGRDVASGLYFYRLITPYGSQVRKMTLLR
jgi:hypothetical protein